MIGCNKGQSIFASRGTKKVKVKAYIYCFLTSLSCLKAYKRGGSVLKSPNLSVRSFWMVPKFDERKTKRIKKENDVERF